MEGRAIGSLTQFKVQKKMKEVILVRHAKSTWDYPVDDRDRPLSVRGIGDITRVARELKDIPVPDAVYSSPANRALHTCMIAMKKLNYTFNLLTISDQLYDFSGSQVEAFVKHLDNNLNRVMVFGHNHAITELVNKWGNSSLDNVPTSGAIGLQFNIEKWADIQEGRTLFTIFPKNLI